MKILALERDVPDIAVGRLDEALLKEEATRVWDLHQAGVIRELYFRADRRAVVLVLECADVEEAGRFLSALPLVQQRLIDFEIIPLTSYPGFARLFAKW